MLLYVALYFFIFYDYSNICMGKLIFFKGNVLPSTLPVRSVFVDDDQQGVSFTAGDTTTIGSSTLPPTPGGILEEGSYVTTPSQDMFESRMEALIREWYRSVDILYTIHPVDGSLLVWYEDDIFKGF